MSRLLAVSFAITLALISSSSPAADRAQQLGFRYDPAELATADTVAKLYERIVSFAKSECRTISNPPINNPHSEQCTKALAEQLITQINSPLLTERAKGVASK